MTHEEDLIILRKEGIPTPTEIIKLDFKFQCVEFCGNYTLTKEDVEILFYAGLPTTKGYEKQRDFIKDPTQIGVVSFERPFSESTEHRLFVDNIYKMDVCYGSAESQIFLADRDEWFLHKEKDIWPIVSISEAAQMVSEGADLRNFENVFWPMLVINVKNVGAIYELHTSRNHIEFTLDPCELP